MQAMQLCEIAQAIGVPCSIDSAVTEISTDTRTIQLGAVFVAIQGENFDGHRFVEAALNKGAVCAIAEKKLPLEDERILYVKSTKEALLSIAKAYKKHYSVKVVGVTGSVGKTTTKDFIACMLEQKFHTLKSLGNENNEIGVPKTLFRLTPEHEACVLELGMSNMGEIALLSHTVEPDVAVITNIGVCHLEYLKTRENICKAKLEICEGMSEDAPLILCGDNDLLQEVQLPNRKILFYGVENSRWDYWAEAIIEDKGKTYFILHRRQNSYPVEIPTLGTHNVRNALAALAVGEQMGIALEEGIEALTHYLPSGMRQNVVEMQGITFVEDCYNASPDSMKAAMETLGKYPVAGRKIAVLADMLELGTLSHEAHRAVADLLKENEIDVAFVFGEESKAIATRGEELELQVQWFDDKIKLTQQLLQTLNKGDVVWFKGSRGMRLEEIIENVYTQQKNAM